MRSLCRARRWLQREAWQVCHGQQDVFFIFQTSATSFSTDSNFLLVSLISSPNALAANSDPVCSFLFSHIDTSSAVTTNLCRPSCPLPCLSARLLVYPPEVWFGGAGSLLTAGLPSRARHVLSWTQTLYEYIAGSKVAEGQELSLWHLFVQKAVQASLCTLPSLLLLLQNYC